MQNYEKKYFTTKDTTSNCRVEMNTSHLEISYKLTLFQKKSCFNFDVHVKERSEGDIFSVVAVSWKIALRRSDHFGFPAPFCY